MSETREYFQRKYPEFIDDIERRFNFTIGNLPVPTNDQQWLDLVKLVYSGASAAKDASIRDYMNICEDLSRKLEEARGRIAELEAAIKPADAMAKILTDEMNDLKASQDAGLRGLKDDERTVAIKQALIDYSNARWLHIDELLVNSPKYLEGKSDA